MSHLRLNLTFLLQQRGITATALARTTGVQQPTLHRILKGTSADPRSATLQPLADYFGVTLDDLYHRDLTTGTAALLQVSVREGPNIKGLVPLLTSVQAGEWCDISQSFQREDAKTWLPCPVKHGPRTFCLTVEGESMKNPGAKPSYEPGDVIFIDPDVAAKPGDRVVVRLESQAAATFKQYLEEDGRKLLKALNPDWHPRYIPINGDATICGVVIGKWVPE
jgi:SOS-response transcriptional repressor LexA